MELCLPPPPPTHHAISQQHNYGKHIISFILWLPGQASWYRLKRSQSNLPRELSACTYASLHACQLVLEQQ